MLVIVRSTRSAYSYTLFGWFVRYVYVLRWSFSWYAANLCNIFGLDTFIYWTLCAGGHDGGLGLVVSRNFQISACVDRVVCFGLALC